MHRDLSMVLVVLLASSGMAIATNLGWHKLAWIPPAPRPMSTAQPTGEEPEPPKLTADQVLDHLVHGTAQFVDARESSEYEAGHLRGALHLASSAAYRNIEDITSMIPTDEKVIVYCGGSACEASHIVADVLAEHLYTDVEIYTGGWEEIEASGKFVDCIVTGEEY